MPHRPKRSMYKREVMWYDLNYTNETPRKGKYNDYFMYERKVKRKKKTGAIIWKLVKPFKKDTQWNY